MTKKEYQTLLNEVMGYVKTAIGGDSDLLGMFEVGTESDFRELPKHRETIRTLKGIYGFLRYCDDNKQPRTSFVFNALHDLSNCVNDYLEKWYSPRLSRFANYEPKSNELKYYTNDYQDKND